MSENENMNPVLRRISEITGHFFVPSYQRGYRWGRHEVEALLDDIYADGKRREDEKYCLQPIVIKEKIAPHDPGEGLPRPGEVYYELIDGQQRLTTLYLVYLFLMEIKGVKPLFSLAYQTRPGSTVYLKNLVADQQDDNIDFFHIYNAYQVMGEWFENAAERTVDLQVMGVADDIYRYLRNHVYVIWYDAGEEDSITLFTRLNVGRIALTNAELVKALLLKSRGKAQSDHNRQIEIVTQWDMIERDMQNDSFWAFLSNQPGSKYPTRIELLFDLLARKEKGEKDRFFTFLFFLDLLDKQDREDAQKKEGEEVIKGPLAVWAYVLELYYLLLEWFENRDHYHKVGYLVATGEKLSDLSKKASGGKLGQLLGRELDDKVLSKSDFLGFLDNRIMERINLDEASARSLDYKNNYQACDNLLLLFNVESVRLLKHSSDLYPFDSHKKEKWSLEHIHAQNAEPLKTEDEWRSWLADGRLALESLPRLDNEEREVAKDSLINEIGAVLSQLRVERKDFSPLSHRIMSEFLNAEGTDAEVDSIANLALLSGKVNSSLNNGAFQVKCLRVIDIDHKGEFIPVCTRRVFLKYYTPTRSQQMHLWSREDQECYLNVMLASPDSANGREEGVVWKYLKKTATED